MGAIHRRVVRVETGQNTIRAEQRSLAKGQKELIKRVERLENIQPGKASGGKGTRGRDSPCEEGGAKEAMFLAATRQNFKIKNFTFSL